MAATLKLRSICRPVVLFEINFDFGFLSCRFVWMRSVWFGWFFFAVILVWRTKNSFCIFVLSVCETAIKRNFFPVLLCCPTQHCIQNQIEIKIRRKRQKSERNFWYFSTYTTHSHHTGEEREVNCQIKEEKNFFFSVACVSSKLNATYIETRILYISFFRPVSHRVREKLRFDLQNIDEFRRTF